VEYWGYGSRIPPVKRKETNNLGLKRVNVSEMCSRGKNQAKIPILVAFGGLTWEGGVKRMQGEVMK